MNLRKSNRAFTKKAPSFFENTDFLEEISREEIKYLQSKQERKKEFRPASSKSSSLNNKKRKIEKNIFPIPNDEFNEVCAGLYDLLMEINNKVKNADKKFEASNQKIKRKIPTQPLVSSTKLKPEPRIPENIIKPVISATSAFEKISKLPPAPPLPPNPSFPSIRAPSEISSLLSQYLKKSSLITNFLKDTSVFANLNFSSIFQYSQKHSNHKIANMELILTMMKNDTLLPNLNFHNENFSLLSFLSNMQSEISNYLYEVGMNAKRNLNEECSEEMDKISKILENMKQFDQQIRDENIGWEGEEKKHAKNEPKKIIPPFKRAGTHVAIAYYIYVSKNKSNSREEEFYNDPVYKSKLLREQQNFDSNYKTEPGTEMATKTNDNEIQENGNNIFSSAKRTLDYVFLENNSLSEKKNRCPSPSKFQIESSHFKILSSKRIGKKDRSRKKRKIKFSLGFKRIIKNLKKKKERCLDISEEPTSFYDILVKNRRFFKKKNGKSLRL